MQTVPITRTTNSAGQEEVSVSFRNEESAWSLYNRLLARGRMQYAYWANESRTAPTDSLMHVEKALDAVPHPDKSPQDDLLGIEYNTARFVPIIDPATGEEREYTEPVRRIRFDVVRHPIVAATCYRTEDLPLFYDLLEMLGVQVEEEQSSSALAAAQPTSLQAMVAAISEERASPEWWNRLFAGYEEYSRTRRATLRNLADAAAYSEPYIKQQRAKWKAEHE